MRNWHWLVAIGLAIGILLMAVLTGSSHLGVLQVCSILAHKLFGTALSGTIQAAEVSIIWTLRLPRVLLAFTVGAVLAVSGCVMQSALKNPLASPHTLGVSSGASLGAGLVIVLGTALPAGGFILPLAGFSGALLTVTLVLVFTSKVDKSMSNMTVILAGMIISLFLNAILTLVTALARDRIEQITIWQMGSFSMRGWSYLRMLLPFALIGSGVLLLLSRELDIMTFGGETATSMGVEVVHIKRLAFLCAALLTGAAVASCGTIGFVDLVAPHLVRKWFGPGHRAGIPLCALVGGTMMVVADMIARTVVSPSELPVGAVTAILGAPFFAYVYFRKMR